MSILNFVCLLGVVLVAGIGFWSKKHGRLSEKKTALFLIGYLSLLTLTVLYPIFKVPSAQGTATIILLLLALWGIGYPWARWLYRKMTPPNS